MARKSRVAGRCQRDAAAMVIRGGCNVVSMVWELNMKIMALALSLFVAALGAAGVVSPPKLLGIVRRFQTPVGFYAAAGIRLVLGAALWLAAPSSRAPEAVGIAGLIIFVAGLITPFLGFDRLSRAMDWWTARGPVFMRAWAGGSPSPSVSCWPVRLHRDEHGDPPRIHLSRPCRRPARVMIVRI
jgi:hypothetical protein